MTAVPVLLVHGFASSFERNWRQPGWVDLLEDAGRPVIGLDLLGHGQAPKPHDPAAYANLEDDLAASLPGDGPADAIGFSLGAQVLLALAAGAPERFRRIVVAGVGANLFRPQDSHPLLAALERGTQPEDVVASAFARFAQAPGNDPLALAACLRRPVAPLDPTRLGGLGVPVLVVLGGSDFAGPAEPLVDALPDARLVMLPGVDHLGTASHFGFIDAALGFLNDAGGVAEDHD